MTELMRQIVSAVLTAVILLLLLLLTLSFGYMPPDPPIPESGVEVSLGYSDDGFGDAEDPTSTAANTSPAAKPQPANEEYATQSTEEAVSMPVKTNTKPAPDKQVQKENPTPVEPEQPKKPEINQNALFKKRGNNSSTNGGSKGNTTGEGAMGNDNGNPEASSQVGNGGSGGGNGVSHSLVGRKALGLPKPSYKSDSEGKVVILVSVDRQGNVVSAENSRGTTVTDQKLIEQCLKAARNSRFSANDNATEKQKGTITYVFSRTN